MPCACLHCLGPLRKDGCVLVWNFFEPRPLYTKLAEGLATHTHTYFVHAKAYTLYSTYLPPSLPAYPVAVQLSLSLSFSLFLYLSLSLFHSLMATTAQIDNYVDSTYSGAAQSDVVALWQICL